MDFDPCPHCSAPLDTGELCRACVPAPSAPWAALVALLVSFALIATLAPSEPLLTAPPSLERGR